ncbi:MAG TPA: hypothetical protein VIJ94_14520 [Caulobacteraceae bacterium]
MPGTPPIPPEKRSFSGETMRDRLRSAQPDRRDDINDPPPKQGGEVSPDRSR